MNLTEKSLDKIYTALNDSLNCYCSVKLDENKLNIDLNPSEKEDPVAKVSFIVKDFVVKIRIFKDCPELCLSYFPFIQEVVENEVFS